MAYLVLAFALALIMGVGISYSLPAWMRVISPVYFHVFMVGWVTQLIFGVVYWMFPRYRREQPRGRTWLAWITLVTLNLGLMLRMVAEPAVALQKGGAWQLLVVIAAMLLWFSGLGFVINTWGRVKER
jgi:hypothetical protein